MTELALDKLNWVSLDVRSQGDEQHADVHLPAGYISIWHRRGTYDVYAYVQGGRMSHSSIGHQERIDPVMAQCLIYHYAAELSNERAA